METFLEFRTQCGKQDKFRTCRKGSIWGSEDKEYLKYMMQKYGDNPECLPFLKNQYKKPYNVVSKLKSMGIYNKPEKTYSVYVIGEFESECDLYKIGYSNNAKNRLKTLQTGNPRTLDIVWSVSVTDQLEAIKLESYMHSKLANYNVGGEWFNLPLDEIKKAFDLTLEYEEAA